MPDDDFATRLAVAGSAVGTNRPGLAATLAQSDLSHSEIQSVGGFASALTLATASRLAADSGAKTNYSATEKNALDGIGESYNQDEDQGPDSRSWLERVTDKVAGAMSNTGNFLLHNPVTGALMWTGEELGNVSHMPFRLVSDAIDQGNNDEIDREMVAKGYDPDKTSSYLAFMFNQGESQYHSLAGARDTYGDDMVDAIIRQQDDPEQFQADFEKMDPTAAADLQQKMQSKEWAAAAQAIDAQHISPGRDVARIVTAGHTDSEAFHLLSGTLDAAYTWFADPTIVLGKLSAGLRALDVAGRVAEDASRTQKLGQKVANAVPALGNRRAGLQSMMDQAGVEAALKTDEAGNAVTKVGKGWQAFLGDAKELRTQHGLAQDTKLSAEERSAAAAKRAGIFRGMQRQYGPLMGLLDEVNGTRVISEADHTGGKIDALISGTGSGGHVVTKGQPIEDLDTLSKYLASPNGLLRLTGGEAARRAVIMPGRLSFKAERTAAGNTRAAKKVEKWIDYTKGHELLPDESELDSLMAMDRAADAGEAQHNLLLRGTVDGKGYNLIKLAKARAERINRRITTLIPQATHIDLTDANSSKLVEQLGRTYLNKADSARLASAYALGDLGTRRGIAKGLLEQTAHASGLSRSESGRTFMDKYLGDQAILERQQYGLAGTSKLTTNRGEVEAALYPDQLSTKVMIPSFRQMNYLATKHAVGGFAGRTKLAHVQALGQSEGMDALMGTIKLGWITSAAGGLRNALDEVVGFAANGMGREALAGRVAFTKVTKDLRDQRRAYSREYLAKVKAQGREATDEELGRALPLADKSHQDAIAGLQAAKNADEARANVHGALARRVENAAARVNENGGHLARARAEHAAATAAGASDDELARLSANVDEFARRHKASKDALRKAKKDHEKPDKAIAAMEASFDKRGVLSVKDAEKELAAAKKEWERAKGLETAIHYRIPLMLRGAADTTNDVLVGAVLGKALSVFGQKYALTPERIGWAQELVDRELTQTMREGVFQAHYGDSAMLDASDHGAMALHREGLQARKYGYVSDGWGNVEVDGGAGLDAWAKTLQLRFADPSSPAHAWVQTMHALTRPAEGGPYGSLEDFAATGEELLHGTAHKFETFSPKAEHANFEGRINQGVYFTNDPETANSFAWDWNGLGVAEHFQPSMWSHAHNIPDYYGVDAATTERLKAANEVERARADDPFGDLNGGRTDPGVLIARADFMEQTLLARLRAGHAVSLRKDGKEVARVTDPDQLAGELDKLGGRVAALNDVDNIKGVNAPFDPRTIKAKVYGRTLDLRDHTAIPDDLRKTLEAEGIYRPWDVKQTANDWNANAHDKSQALIDYMRANGFGQARVHDSGGFDSRIVLPEMIAHGDNDPVAAYAKKLSGEGGMSRVDWAAAHSAAKRSVRTRLDEEDLRHFVDNAEVFKFTEGGTPIGNDPVLLAKAKDAYAEKVAEDLTHALGNKEAGLNDELMGMLAGGEVPDRSWLAQIDKEQRPEHAIGQLWAPFNAKHKPGTFPTGYTQMLSKAYGKVVTDQINALSRNPIVTALYMNARKNTAGYEQHLIDAGWDKASAAEVAKRVALQHAETTALKHIDNPYVSSQTSMVVRNYAAFIRAQEDWLRRWGRTIKDNPEVIRKGQLLIHGGTSAGMVEKDDQGNLTFIYPGSGMALGLFSKLFGVFGEQSAATVPMTGELSSQLTFLNPSLDNPIGFSGTPLVSLPLKAFSKFLGDDHALLNASLDKAVNGDMGAGRAWYEQLLPGWANRIMGGVISEDPGSKYGAAYTQALANLEAAGALDDPELQTASGKARFQHALSVQIKNNLAATALLGFFAPASPAMDSVANTTAAGHQGAEPDWSAHKEGLDSLKDEARQVFARLPYDKALAWWTAVHPNELIYAQTGASARTQAGTKGASAPATVAAARWMEENTDFINGPNGYGGKGGIATYFMPQGVAGTTSGEYSDVAYRAQLESGIRDYKSLDDYFDDVVTARGSAQYYKEKAASDLLISHATQSGSTSQVKALQAQWKARKAEILAGNPLLAEKFAQYATQNAVTGSQISQLTRLVQDNSPATVKALGGNRNGVAALLAAYDQYQGGVGQLGDRRGAAATRQRQQFKDTYTAAITQLSTQYPGLTDLVNGVFQLPD